MTSNEEAMGLLPAWKLIRKLAIPTVIITLVMALYNMADIFFIGKTGNADMVNAISVCMPAFTVIQAFGTLIGAGGCTAVSIALGRGEKQKSRNLSSFCFWFCLTLSAVLGILLFVLSDQVVTMLGASVASHDYAAQYLRVLAFGCPIMLFSNAFVNILRADGSVKESMAANLSGTFTNILLDPLMILTFGMGVRGAAVATVIGNAVAAGITLAVLRKKPIYTLSPRELSLRRDVSLRTLSLGLPLSAGTLLMSVSYMVLNNLLLAVDPDAQGAFGISRTIMLLSTMIQMGICMGVQPAVCYAYGQGNISRVKELIRKTTIVCMGFGLLVAAVCIGFRSAILGAFIRDEAILSYGKPILLGCFITAPVYGLYQSSATFLQATERPLASTVITLLRQGGLLIPAMLLLNHVAGFDGLVYCFAVTDVLAAAAGCFLLSRRLRKLADAH